MLAGCTRPDRCVDLRAEARVCFRGGALVGVRRVATDARGRRCDEGDPPRCVDRAQQGGPFVCDGARCVQADPRMPDDGEWECADLDGAVICHGGGPAAGVVAGPADVGWACGPRAGLPAERVCVDLAPDRPAGAWTCRFEHVPSQRRICERGAKRPQIGEACAACPAGTICRDGRCLPARFDPACYFDRDCGPGKACRVGTCVAGGDRS